MAKCEVCENEYDKAFDVVVAGKQHTFDSFECVFTRSRRYARIAIAGSSGTALSRAAKSSVVSIARAAADRRS
jgi:hypothetical protein